MEACGVTVFIEGKLYECELKKRHLGPHHETYFRLEDEAFITMEWFNDQEPDVHPVHSRS